MIIPFIYLAQNHSSWISVFLGDMFLAALLVSAKRRAERRQPLKAEDSRVLGCNLLQVYNTDILGFQAGLDITHIV